MNGEEALEYMRQNPEEVLLDKNGHRWVWDGPFADFEGFAKHYGGDLSGCEPFATAKHCGGESDLQSPAAGRKDDTGKPRISLLPADVLREMFSTYAYPEGPRDVFQAVHVDRATDIRVSRAAFTLLGRLSTKLGGSREQALGEVVKAFEHGAAKYGDENWRTVEPERYRGAAFRHVFMTEGPDSDSGIDALAHGIASLMILRALQLEAGK